MCKMVEGCCIDGRTLTSRELGNVSWSILKLCSCGLRHYDKNCIHASYFVLGELCWSCRLGKVMHCCKHIMAGSAASQPFSESARRGNWEEEIMRSGKFCWSVAAFDCILLRRRWTPLIYIH